MVIGAPLRSPLHFTKASKAARNSTVHTVHTAHICWTTSNTQVHVQADDHKVEIDLQNKSLPLVFWFLFVSKAESWQMQHLGMLSILSEHVLLREYSPTALGQVLSSSCRLLKCTLWIYVGVFAINIAAIQQLLLWSALQPRYQRNKMVCMKYKWVHATSILEEWLIEQWLAQDGMWTACATAVIKSMIQQPLNTDRKLYCCVLKWKRKPKPKTKLDIQDPILFAVKHMKLSESIRNQ